MSVTEEERLQTTLFSLMGLIQKDNDIFENYLIRENKLEIFKAYDDTANNMDKYLGEGNYLNAVLSAQTCVDLMNAYLTKEVRAQYHLESQRQKRRDSEGLLHKWEKWANRRKMTIAAMSRTPTAAGGRESKFTPEGEAAQVSDSAVQSVAQAIPVGQHLDQFDQQHLQLIGVQDETEMMAGAAGGGTGAAEMKENELFKPSRSWSVAQTNLRPQARRWAFK